ncbi:hypothetical protein B0H13DRAFT_1919631 [Mycena leptocephala]|nr:hypothetical protein B0H13DRAFT_1919631 [Mycena leptocephala]
MWKKEGWTGKTTPVEKRRGSSLARGKRNLQGLVHVANRLRVLHVAVRAHLHHNGQLVERRQERPPRRTAVPLRELHVAQRGVLARERGRAPQAEGLAIDAVVLRDVAPHVGEVVCELRALVALHALTYNGATEAEEVVEGGGNVGAVGRRREMRVGDAGNDGHAESLGGGGSGADDDALFAGARAGGALGLPFLRMPTPEVTGVGEAAVMYLAGALTRGFELEEAGEGEASSKSTVCCASVPPSQHLHSMAHNPPPPKTTHPSLIHHPYEPRRRASQPGSASQPGRASHTPPRSAGSARPSAAAATCRLHRAVRNQPRAKTSARAVVCPQRRRDPRDGKAQKGGRAGRTAPGRPQGTSGKRKRVGRRVEEVEGRVLRVEVVAEDRIVEVGNGGHPIGEGLVAGYEGRKAMRGEDMILVEVRRGPTKNQSVFWHGGAAELPFWVRVRESHSTNPVQDMSRRQHVLGLSERARIRALGPRRGASLIQVGIVGFTLPEPADRLASASSPLVESEKSQGVLKSRVADQRRVLRNASMLCPEADVYAPAWLHVWMYINTNNKPPTSRFGNFVNATSKLPILLKPREEYHFLGVRKPIHIWNSKSRPPEIFHLVMFKMLPEKAENQLRG